MGLSVQELLQGTRHLEVEFGKSVLHLDYDAQHYTLEEEEDHNEWLRLQRENGESYGARATVARILRMVKKWDLLDPDKKPIPLTEDGLRTVPKAALEVIYAKVLEDMIPTPKP